MFTRVPPLIDPAVGITDENDNSYVTVKLAL